EVRVTDVGSGAVDDHGDSCGAATAITADGSVTQVITDPGPDEDWLAVSCVAGYRYELTTFVASGAYYPTVKFIDTDCSTVLAEWAYGIPDELSFFAANTATYYL